MSIMEMSIQAGMLIIAIIILRAVALRKLNNNIFLILWKIVIIRLLIPFSIISDFSIYNISATIKTYCFNELIIINNKYYTIGSLINNIFTEPIVSIIQIIFIIIWIIGLIILTVHFIKSYIKDYKILRYALPVDNECIINWIENSNISKKIKILQSDRITTPLSYGIIKPRIILSKNIDFNETELMNYILTHEYCHLKRHEPIWKILLVAALCIHWFSPLIWVMYILINRDIEITCDEMVLRRTDINRKAEYAYTLISVAETNCYHSPLFNYFNHNAITERITMIMNYKKSNTISIIVSVLIILGSISFILSSSGALNKGVFYYSIIDNLNIIKFIIS